jgi:hypothetical protein
LAIDAKAHMPIGQFRVENERASMDGQTHGGSLAEPKYNSGHFPLS